MWVTNVVPPDLSAEYRLVILRIINPKPWNIMTDKSDETKDTEFSAFLRYLFKTCCNDIDGQRHQRFTYFLLQFKVIWQHFRSDNTRNTSRSITDEYIGSCQRDFFLAHQTGFGNNESFVLLRAEQTEPLVGIIWGEKYRFWHISGKYSTPQEAVDSFYSEMSAKGNWFKFDGFSRVSTWLRFYLFGFFRQNWNEGIKDQEDSVMSQNTDQEGPRKKNSRDRRFQALPDDYSECDDSDPQTAMLRSSIRQIARECFSIFSPNDLQFICQLRACRRGEITQKEIAKQLKIDESTLTRRKQQLHERFTERFLALFKQSYPSMEIRKKDVTLAPEDDWEDEKENRDTYSDGYMH